MPIIGTPKIFSQSVVQSVSATTNNATAALMINPDNITQWLGSTTDTIELSFITSNINRIIIAGHNLENYTIQYDNNNTLTDFTNVLSFDAIAGNSINESSYSRDTSYYEFDTVNTNKVTLVFNNASNNGSIEYIAITNELGTFTHYPKVSSEVLDRSIVKRTGLNKRYLPSYGVEIFEASLKFKKNPSQEDYDLYSLIHTLNAPFLLWLCGGDDTDGFGIKRRNWRLRDIFLVHALSDNNASFVDDWYGLGFDATLKVGQAST